MAEKKHKTPNTHQYKAALDGCQVSSSHSKGCGSGRETWIWGGAAQEWVLDPEHSVLEGTPGAHEAWGK